jgi:UDP-N-acetylglucosamine--dolichyl-phosphate N-acetylglucosaminephosphotransferase
MLSFLFTAIASFLIVIFVTPSTMKMLREKGKTGVDVHKPSKPEIPKGGGLVVLFAIVTALLFVIGLMTITQAAEINSNILAALVSILLAGMIGILDDFLDFRNRTKIILPLVATIPMVALQVGTQTMEIPFIGTVNLGVAYPLVVVPLMMTFIIDSTNMYAGMNGLEAGLAFVNSSSIVVYLLLEEAVSGTAITPALIDAGLVAAAVMGATLAFLFFNKYPARVLSGDVGLLSIGAALAASLIMGNMDRLAIFLYLTFGINFVLYLFYRIRVGRTGMKYVKFASPRDDGTLQVAGPYTLYWLLPHAYKRTTERSNVLALVLLQAGIAYGAVLMFIFGLPFIGG